MMDIPLNLLETPLLQCRMVHLLLIKVSDALSCMVRIKGALLVFMQELGTDVNLYALVFGESVLNDAVNCDTF